MRFHVLAVPISITRKDFTVCSTTILVLDWCKMMHARGHTIYHYGHEDSEVDCIEHIPVVFEKDIQQTYPGRNWKRDGVHGSTEDHVHQAFNIRAIHEIQSRKQFGDFLLCFWGFSHKPVANAHPDLIAVDPTVGIDHPVSLPYSIFASYSVMNRVYGKSNIDPRWYDAVIPHFFDVNQFEFNPTPKDYFLYIGRIIPSKGINIAIDLAKAAGMKIVIAGTGNVRTCKENVPDHVIEMGSVNVEQRCELMKNAKAFIAPSHYCEPFGMAVVEAMLCGTPVITTDWGGFAETVLHGVTGYRCRTQEQFNWAANNIGSLNRQTCRDWAVNNYSMERIAPMFEEYFDTLSKVSKSGGFYFDNTTRTDLNWMVRQYPPSS